MGTRYAVATLEVAVPTMRLLVIYNPAAAHGRARRQLPIVRRLCAQAGVDIEVLQTQHPGHGTEIAATADLGPFDGIVAGGGDGTIFEVVNGYFRNPGARGVPFGVLPVGTGNAFARDLDLRTNQCEEAVSLLARNQPRAIDVGRFRTADVEAYFLNIIGLGFVSDVTATAMKMKAIGNFAYTLGVLYQTIFLRSSALTIETGGRVIERDTIFLEISNTRYTSNFLIAPDARIDDGLLDVVLLKAIPRRRLLRCFPTIFSGEHVHLDDVETFTTDHIRVTADSPKRLAPDGELLGTTPVEVECLPSALRVFA